MPAKKISSKRNYRRRIYRKKKRGLKVRVKQLESKVQAERKFVDVNSTTAVSSSGVVAYLAAISQGTDVSNRQGRQIKPFKYEYSATITMNGSATKSTLRAIIFQDRQAIGTSPSVTTVLVSAAVTSLYNLLSAKDRFIILMDKSFVVDADDPLLYDMGSCRLSNRINFIGTGATDASAGQNGLFVLFISDEATNTPSINWQHRLHYYDN